MDSIFKYIIAKLKPYIILVCLLLVPIAAYSSKYDEDNIEMRIYNSPELYPYLQEDSGYYYLPFYMAQLGHYVEIEYKGRTVPLHQLNTLPYYKNLAPKNILPKLQVNLVKKNSIDHVVLPDHISENIVKIILFGINEEICDCYCFAGILQGNEAYSGFISNNTQDLDVIDETPLINPGDYIQSQIFYDGYSVYNHIATNIGDDLFISKTGLLGYYIISDLKLIKTEWGSHIVHSRSHSSEQCASSL